VEVERGEGSPLFSANYAHAKYCFSNANPNPNGLFGIAALMLDYNNIELLTLQLNYITITIS